MLHLIRMPPDVSCSTHDQQVEITGKTQNTPDGLGIPSGLRTSQDTPGIADECGWGEGHLGYFV